MATKTKKLTIDQMLQGIAELTVLELSELVSEIEKKFNVSATPVMTEQSVEVEANTEKEEEEQTNFSVVMTDFGDKKIHVIKAVRTKTSESLIDCKKAVEALGSPLMEGMSKDEADEFARLLMDVGATVEVK